MLRTVVKVAGAMLAFCVVHSLFADARVKNAVQHRAGTRNRNGLYRAFYSGQSVLSLAALIAYGRKQPNTTLYEVRGRAAWLMRAGQLLSLLAQAHTTYQVGFGRFSGLTNLWAWLRGKRAIEPEPEGQGPTQNENGDMQASGLFQVSRNAPNMLPLPLLWLQPRMTARWMGFSLVASLYFYLGSFLTAARMRTRYGRAYQDYERSGTAFYLPRLPDKKLPRKKDDKE